MRTGVTGAFCSTSYSFLVICFCFLQSFVFSCEFSTVSKEGSAISKVFYSVCTSRYYCMDDKVCVCNACTIEGGHLGHTIKTLKNTMKDLKVSCSSSLWVLHQLEKSLLPMLRDCI